jgi:dTDP-4-amino-4,6-dideoxygalactose transaminase
MKVPLLDLKAQYQALKGEILPVIESVCDSQAFILGAHTSAFEAACAEYCGVPHAVGVSSGTDALLLAMMALGVGGGDAVIVPTFTFFATAGTVVRTGAHPVFLDIDPVTFNLCPAALRSYLEERCDRSGGVLRDRASGALVKAVVPVHLYGQCADMSTIAAIAREFGLWVIEDAAQAIGAEAVDHRRAGSIGDIGCFSFFPSKNLGAFGDAGLCTTRDDGLAERLRVLRVHGGKPKYYHAVVGGNFRIDEIQSAVLGVKLRHLDSWTAGRQRNAALYRKEFNSAGLDGVVRLPVETPGVRHIYNQFVIRVERRDALRDHLTRHEIGTEIYYPVPLHLQQCFASLGGRVGDCPESERAAADSVALPVYPELTPEQISYVVEAIGRFYRH